MNDEKDRILKLLEDKKITADEAARLLDALNTSEPNGRANKFLKVRVYREGAERPTVNVTLPVSLVRWGMHMMPASARAKIEEQEIDMHVISEALEKGITGKIVDVQDDEKGEHVEVWLE
jgi:SHOCT-like domain